MSITATIAALALTALLIWTIGPTLARVGGALVVIASLIGIVLGSPLDARLPALAGGVALWLAGRYLDACKNRIRAAQPVRPSRGAVYGTRAVKAATNLAVRKVPGARTARSAWRFVR